MADDRILIHGLRVLAYCGVLAEEQSRRQPFEIDLEVLTDLRRAGETDELDDTIDYGALTDRVVDFATQARVALLEHFAHRIAGIALADERVAEVVVEVRKLRPPVPHDLASSGVRITRTR